MKKITTLFIALIMGIMCNAQTVDTIVFGPNTSLQPNSIAMNTGYFQLDMTVPVTFHFYVLTNTNVYTLTLGDSSEANTNNFIVWQSCDSVIDTTVTITPPFIPVQLIPYTGNWFMLDVGAALMNKENAYFNITCIAIQDVLNKIDNTAPIKSKQVANMYNMHGQSIKTTNKFEPYIIRYKDGTVEKRMIIQ